MALHTAGHGFTLIDPAKPEAARIANAVDHHPLGLWGDDVVLLESAFGYTCAPLGPTTKDCPKLDLPLSVEPALSEDRRCLLCVSDKGKVTVRLRERTLLQDYDPGWKITFAAVSGSGEVWAVAHEWDIRIMRRRADGTYAEAAVFDAGSQVRELQLSADGTLLLARLQGSEGCRAVVYRESGGAWRPACGPFDYADVADWSTFAAAGRLVVSIAALETRDDEPHRVRLEVRRTTDDGVVAETTTAPSNLQWLQLGAATKLPLIRDGRLFYRDLETQTETPTETNFTKDLEPLIVHADLNQAILRLPDGRLAVRSLEK